jgi:outer membrane protein assembly factor BamB
MISRSAGSLKIAIALAIGLSGCERSPAGLGTAPGRVRWRIDLPNGDRDRSITMPSLATGSLAIIAVDGFAYGLDPANGSLRWQASDARLRASGRFFDTRAGIVGLFPPNVVAVSADSGRVLWAQRTLPIGTAGAYSNRDTDAYLIAGERVGYRVDLRDGTTQAIAVRQVGDTVTTASNLIVMGDTIYSRLYRENSLNSLIGQLWLGRFDRISGIAFAPLRFPTDSIAPNATITVSGDHAFISDADRNEVWAWNRFTGVARRIHKVRGGFGNLAPVKVSGDTLVVPASDLNMYVYSISTGQRLFTVPTRSSLSSVAICGDVIYMQHSYIEAVSRATGKSLGIAYEPGTVDLAPLTNGPDYVLGWGPRQAFALECPP